MSVINKGDFAVTNVNSKTTMSYRVPSIERINFVSIKEKAYQELAELNRKRNKATKGSQKKRKRKL